MIREAIQILIEQKNLAFEQAQTIMREIMSGEASPSQIAAFLTGLRIKGETAEELLAFAEIMKQHSRQIHPKTRGRLVDTCGTGGDKVKTFNISTAAAFVIAGARISIAKHGNRSVTSRSGSADVMERLGLNLNMDPLLVEKAIEQVGIGFMFAPIFHPAMKYAVEPRREMGIRTTFNLLGPLTNPASASAQLLGVYDPRISITIASALLKLGCEEAMVVHGWDGLDEISTLGKTSIAWLREGEINKKEITPKELGIKQSRIEDIKGTGPEESAEILFNILKGSCAIDDPKLEIVLANSAAGIMVGGEAENFKEGIEIARRSIESGEAYKKLRALIKFSNGNETRLEELERKNG